MNAQDYQIRKTAAIKRREEIYSKTVTERREEVKAVLLRTDEPKYLVKKVSSPHKRETRRSVIPGKVQEMMMLDAWARREECVGSRGALQDMEYLFIETDFISFEECTPEEQARITMKEEQVKKIKMSLDDRYDRKGKVTIPVYSFSYRGDDYLSHDEKYLQDQLQDVGSLEIEVTPRELAEAGILYGDLDWRPTKFIDIVREVADATREAKVGNRNIQVARTFIKNLLDMVKGVDKNDAWKGQDR